MAGCLSWSSFHLNRSLDLLMTREEMTNLVWTCVSGYGGKGQGRSLKRSMVPCVHVTPAVSHRPMSIHHRLIGCSRVQNNLLPALMVPVHDFKLFPQPPTGEGVEKKNIRLKECEKKLEIKWSEGNVSARWHVLYCTLTAMLGRKKITPSSVPVLTCMLVSSNLKYHKKELFAPMAP